jgi:hypothetical protein
MAGPSTSSGSADQGEPANRSRSSPETASPPFNDDWRRWIAENLLIDNSPESILDVLVSIGFAWGEAAEEIRQAQQSPYLRGGDLLRNRLKKRDWALSLFRKLNRLHPHSSEIERRHKLSREEFLRDYYCTNRPVIITGMIDDWPAMSRWGLDYFNRLFGDRMVEVQMGRDSSPEYETERGKFVTRIRFGDFIEKVRNSGETNDFYLTANNNSVNKQVLPELWDDIVPIPEYLANDQQAGFFWMGPAGTVTPFHHDLTNNFMAQVLGRKLIRIAPSWDLPLMRNHLHCFSQVDGRVTPARPRPAFEEAQVLELILSPGELLFLPVGCFHYVQGIDITVTMSYTNFVFDNDFNSFYSTYGQV